MNGKIGPLLTEAMKKMSNTATKFEAMALASDYGSETGGPELPVVVKLPTIPSSGMEWQKYQSIVGQRIKPFQQMLQQLMGQPSELLITANALKTHLTPPQIDKLSQIPDVEVMELDPLVQVVQMDDSVVDLDLNNFQIRKPGIDGSGVKVAVLDSGLDLKHPYLKVFASVDTSGESVNIPGDHGTHCAGSIASQDLTYPGIAPGVDLLNVKVLHANGQGKHTNITKGIDEALNLGAQVLSMSLGFNHLPAWSDRGHGWVCSDGGCTLCTAVDNAVSLDNLVVVVAAGNEHNRAEMLRSWGHGATFDSEVSCPGQARLSLTVGALTKATFLPADFSSRGPTAFGTSKPDLAAPGVNITSTIPVPRDASGQPISNPPRASLFGRKSGTSMATPIVAAVAALIIQMRKAAGLAWTPNDVRNDMISSGALPIAYPPNLVGSGRLSLKNL